MMGQRKSKQNKGSYDVAPVVSDQDFTYQNEADNGDPQKLPQVLDSSTAAQKDAEKPFDPKLIPSWLTEEIFVDVLKENIEGFERIENFKAYPALVAGENYATLMLRISIDAVLNDKSTKNISYMLKVAHDSEQMRQMLSFANYFIPENEMLLEVIPEMEQMYKAANADIEFAPNAYHFPKTVDENYVLLKDLRPLGFKNANRVKCLDMAHAKCVLRKMAQFHAASATRVATKGPYIDVLMNGVFSGKPEAIVVFDAMIGSFRTAFLNNVKSYKDGEKYEPYMKDYLTRFAQEYQSIASYNENEFNVLNHGDCWSNNVLFKYNDAGEIVDTQFIDFQMSKYGSPVQDVYYFIFSSLQTDIKLKQFDYLIRFYYDNLIESLKLLNYPKKLPILREFYMQLFKYGIWTISTSIITLPIVLLDPTDIAKMDNFMSDDKDGMAFKNALFSNKRYQEHINEIMPWLYNRGLMEPYNIPSTEKVANATKQTILAPDWVTESIFIDVLKKKFTNFKSIKKFNVSPGTSGGDNYASMMLKIDIEMELENHDTKSTSFMMKVALNNKEASEIMNNLNIFDKEILMYQKYIPKFEEIYKKSGVDITLGPKYFDLIEKPEENMVVLEDLRPLGYKNCNRLEGLDEEHTKAVLQRVAEFHAASAIFALENDFPSILLKGMYAEDQRELFKKMEDIFLPLFNECLKSFDGNEEYYDKVIANGKTFFDSILKSSNIEDSYINVLNHGDLWTNNILFKHDENGKLENTCLIDFQMVQYGSPAFDLYYFLISSPALEIKLEKFDHFVKYYYDNLVKNLKLLNYTKYIPTLQEFHQEILQKGVLGYASTTGILSAVLLDPTDQANMENMLSEDSVGVELRRQMYSNARYKKHAEAIIPWLNRRGLLDAE